MAGDGFMLFILVLSLHSRDYGEYGYHRCLKPEYGKTKVVFILDIY